mgnify:FL=1
MILGLVWLTIVATGCSSTYVATVGGGAPYRYGSGGGPYTYGTQGAVTATGHPVVTVPIESEPYWRANTMRQYGFSEGNGGHSDGYQNPQKFYGYSQRP